MTEQTMTSENVPKGKVSAILRQVVKWSILALVLFTCIPAAYRKFGS
jgi:hypothetical protein